MPALTRPAVNGFIADLLDAGAEAATARARQLSLRRFSAWLAEEGEIPRDGLLGLKPPKLDSKIVESLTDEELAALIKACVGKTFRDRRDEAIVRLMGESAVRSQELLSMTIPNTNLTTGITVVLSWDGDLVEHARPGHQPDHRHHRGPPGQGRKGPHRALRAAHRRCGSATGARSSATTRCATR